MEVQPKRKNVIYLRDTVTLIEYVMFVYHHGGFIDLKEYWLSPTQPLNRAFSSFLACLRNLKPQRHPSPTCWKEEGTASKGAHEKEVEYSEKCREAREAAGILLSHEEEDCRCTDGRDCGLREPDTSRQTSLG
jgi:hypothetical protein